LDEEASSIPADVSKRKMDERANSKDTSKAKQRKTPSASSGSSAAAVAKETKTDDMKGGSVNARCSQGDSFIDHQKLFRIPVHV
jgi:hypothetical protein